MVEEECRVLGFLTLATRSVVGDPKSGMMMGAARTIILI
jgi:hypothetical protein